MEEVIKKLKNLNNQNKKIIIVGNRPFQEKLGNVIDSYDYVIRFNFNPYFLATGKLDSEIYGKKTNMIMINRFTESLFFVKGQPVTNFNNEDITNFKKYIKSYDKDIVTLTGVSNIKSIGHFFKKVIDYCDSTTLLIKAIKTIFELDNINDDPKFVLTMGLYAICYFLINDIKFDVAGFNLTDQSYERSYYTCFTEISKKKYPNSLEKLKSHSTGFEVDLLNKLYNKNVFKVIDYPSEEYVLRKNGCVKLRNTSKFGLENLVPTIEGLRSFLETTSLFRDFSNSIFKTNLMECSGQLFLAKNDKMISLDSSERAITFCLVMGKTEFEYIPESNYNEDFNNKVSMSLTKGDVLCYDVRLQRGFITDEYNLYFTFVLRSRIERYNKFVKNCLGNPNLDVYKIDNLKLDNETPICLFNQELTKDDLKKRLLFRKKVEINKMNIGEIDKMDEEKLKAELDDLDKKEENRLKKVENIQEEKNNKTSKSTKVKNGNKIKNTIRKIIKKNKTKKNIKNSDVLKV